MRSREWELLQQAVFQSGLWWNISVVTIVAIIFLFQTVLLREGPMQGLLWKRNVLVLGMFCQHDILPSVYWFNISILLEDGRL